MLVTEMKPTFLQSLVVIIGITALQDVAGADTANSLNLGFGGLNPMPHCLARVFTLEYEHKYTQHLVIVGRGSGVNYRHNKSGYLEEGKLRGLDLGLRYYYAGQMKGLYTGASLGYWHNDWTFIRNRDTANQLNGDAEFSSTRLNFDLGYRFPVQNTNISIMPEIDLGKFFASNTCNYTSPASWVGTPCQQTSDVEGYLFAGVTIGVAF